MKSRNVAVAFSFFYLSILFGIFGQRLDRPIKSCSSSIDVHTIFTKMAPQPHVMVIPYPAQGHVIPLMELSVRLVGHGFKVTFVNSDFIHARVVSVLSDHISALGDGISLVSIPDGLGPEEDRNDIGKVSESMYRVMPGKLEELIEDINGVDGNRIKCVISDATAAWPLVVADKMKIPGVGFWPPAAALFVLGSLMPKLIDDGVVNHEGTPLKHETIRLAPDVPLMDPSKFVWCCIGDDHATQKFIFELMLTNMTDRLKLAKWVICNTSPDLEPGSFNFDSRIRPIGPLLASRRNRSSVGHFWPEDSTCLKWLDRQPPRSVIYVAFGSFTVFDRTQFQELALGLELTNRPFLWVVRPDITKETNDIYPIGFQDRVSGRGKMVGWAPQQQVLSHPSVACFVSHCGWNSTVEGLSNGLPFLCWPYFADQFLNENYVCDMWKIGLRFSRDASGIITRDEIRYRVDRVLGDEEFEKRALELKRRVERSIEEGGESHKNLLALIEWMEAL